MTDVTRLCARHDCGKPLAPGAQHNAKYCSDNCRRSVFQRQVYADAALVRAARVNGNAHKNAEINGTAAESPAE